MLRVENLCGALGDLLDVTPPCRATISRRCLIAQLVHAFVQRRRGVCRFCPKIQRKLFLKSI